MNHWRLCVLFLVSSTTAFASADEPFDLAGLGLSELEQVDSKAAHEVRGQGFATNRMTNWIALSAHRSLHPHHHVGFGALGPRQRFWWGYAHSLPWLRPSSDEQSPFTLGDWARYTVSDFSKLKDQWSGAKASIHAPLPSHPRNPMMGGHPPIGVQFSSHATFNVSVQ